METASVREWFDAYLRAFAACGRGESDDLSVLLQYYAVPLLLSTDHAVLALTTSDEVLGAARQQIEGMRAADYERSETLESEIVALNADQCSSYRGVLTTAQGRQRNRTSAGDVSHY